MSTRKTKPTSTPSSSTFEPPTRPAAVGEGRTPEIDAEAAEARDAALANAAEGAADYERGRAEWLASQEEPVADAPSAPETDAPPAGDGSETKDA